MTARRWIVALAALAVVALTARLGFWQLDRAAQKTALQQQIKAQAARPPVTAAELQRGGPLADAIGRSAVLQGRWLPGRTLFLDNRQMGGRPGFYVLGAFQPEGSAAALVVQRGWVPRHPQDRRQVPPVEPPAGLWTIEGRIAPPPSRLFELGGEEGGAIRQNVELAGLVREWGVSLLAVSLVQTVAERPGSAPAVPAQPADGAVPSAEDRRPGLEPGAPDALERASPPLLQRDWPEVAVDVHKHHGYAFQWFALSALTAGLYVWFQLLRPRRRRPKPAR